MLKLHRARVRLIAALGLAACGSEVPTGPGPANGPVRVTVDAATSIRVGQPVTFTVTNHSGEAVMINAGCSAPPRMVAVGLYWDGSKWTAPAIAVVCLPPGSNDQPVLIPDGASAQGTTQFDGPGYAALEIYGRTASGAAIDIFSRVVVVK